MKVPHLKTIKVCSGIGDNIWLFQKLLSTGEKYNFQICDRGPHRGHQLFECFPQLVAHHEYADFSTEDVEDNNIQIREPRFTRISQNEFFLSINKHLERGNAIEDFFPDLHTNFDLLPQTGKEYEAQAQAIVNEDSKPIILLYCSAYGGTRAWGFWDESGWLRLARSLGNGFRYIVIGADFDMDLGENVVRTLSTHGFTVKPMFAKNIKLIIELMRKVAYFYSFPSGMPIMATLIGTPTMMFYPAHLHPMMNTWAPPKMIGNKMYLASKFIEPEQAVADSQYSLKNAMQKRGYI